LGGQPDVGLKVLQYQVDELVRVFPTLTASAGIPFFGAISFKMPAGVATYSNDLRERVAALVLSGLTVRAAAAQMQVSVASSARFSRAARAMSSASAKPTGGKRAYLLAGQRDFLLARLAEKPDLTPQTQRRHRTGLLEA
jgi:hypothetical protein